MSQRSLPPCRHDTPAPGWESGVWFRIRRRRRVRALLAAALMAVAAGAAARLARRAADSALARVQVRTAPQGTLRPDGSAPLDTRWRVSFEGAEVRVYRNALGAVHRCPGDPECTASPPGGELTMRIEGPGEYRAAVFSRRVPGESRTLQEDVAAARAAGAQVELSASLVAY